MDEGQRGIDMQFTANRKVWIAADGKTLVADGDPEAKSLLAARGIAIPASRLAIFLNSSEFFPIPEDRKEPEKKDTPRKKEK